MRKPLSNSALSAWPKVKTHILNTNVNFHFLHFNSHSSSSSSSVVYTQSTARQSSTHDSRRRRFLCVFFFSVGSLLRKVAPAACVCVCMCRQCFTLLFLSAFSALHIERKVIIVNVVNMVDVSDCFAHRPRLKVRCSKVHPSQTPTPTLPKVALHHLPPAPPPKETITKSSTT